MLLGTNGSSVAILLATKDGARYLRDQLDSFAAQSHQNWRLFVSDDGSSDETVSILKEFGQRVSFPVEIRAGPNRGHAANFLSLARDEGIRADFFAFSDQDDIWLNDKLERAIAALRQHGHDKPTLYCSRTLLVDENDRTVLGRSPLFTLKPGFGNALVQNIGGGNTMLFNRATKRLLERTRTNVVGHDWWTYQLVTAAGGVTVYDPIPSLRYRQHSGNAIGSNQGWGARSRRMLMLAEGRFGAWNQVNISALRAVEGVLTPNSEKQLDLFERARQGPVFSRLANLLRSGVYRQTMQGNIALYIAALLSKL